MDSLNLLVICLHVNVGIFLFQIHESMKVLKIIKINRVNLVALSKLDCIEYIKHRADGLVVKLKEEYTNGFVMLHSEDYLVEFENGLYQRFGSEAIQRLVKNP